MLIRSLSITLRSVGLPVTAAVLVLGACTTTDGVLDRPAPPTSVLADLDGATWTMTAEELVGEKNARITQIGSNHDSFETVASKGVVVVAVDAKSRHVLTGLRANDGGQVWQRKFPMRDELLTRCVGASDGEQIACLTYDGTGQGKKITVLNTRTGKERVTINATASDIGVHGDWLYTATRQGEQEGSLRSTTVARWSLTDGEKSWHVVVPTVEKAWGHDGYSGIDANDRWVNVYSGPMSILLSADNGSVPKPGRYVQGAFHRVLENGGFIRRVDRYDESKDRGEAAETMFSPAGDELVTVDTGSDTYTDVDNGSVVGVINTIREAKTGAEVFVARGAQRISALGSRHALTISTDDESVTRIWDLAAGDEPVAPGAIGSYYDVGVVVSGGVFGVVAEQRFGEDDLKSKWSFVVIDTDKPDNVRKYQLDWSTEPFFGLASASLTDVGAVVSGPESVIGFVG